ncbi:hypothetical protein AB0A74_12475 [Saccharothrix sp. NPDC042600]|uniref:hypothetical protein n=1 Tax=Saccharothrix TaxID=2071 RepID=UPI0033F9882D|nr:hypothetical protein GCM10017745_84610 [Saccharothrix mutabilis subsp. capreolus]
MSSSRGNHLQPLLGVVTAITGLSAFLLVGGLFGTVLDALRKPVCVRDTWRETCIETPTGGERALSLLLHTPTSVVYVGALLLLLVLLVRAQRLGAHNTHTADDVRGYGLFLLVALPVSTFVEALTRWLLAPYDTWSFVGDWDFPWWAVLTGLGLVSLARVLDAGAEMRAELEGTV